MYVEIIRVYKQNDMAILLLLTCVMSTIVPFHFFRFIKSFYCNMIDSDEGMHLAVCSFYKSYDTNVILIKVVDRND